MSAPFEVDVYHAIIAGQPHLSAKNSFEIIEKKWHSIESLPSDPALPIQDILQEIQGA